jgi:hypothetical protein
MHKIALSLVMVILCTSLTGCYSPSIDPPQTGENPLIENPKLLIITVDVEAGPHYADSDHVNRLIYGRFGNQSAGITEMMDVADEIGVAITFFVDVFAYYAYSDQIIEVMHDINSRGHDVQLHMHPSMINSTTWDEIENSEEWNQSGAIREVNMNCWTQETANYWFSKSMDIFDKAQIPRPIAYRGGAYRYCDTIIVAMKNHNMTQSYNYNIFSVNQTFASENFHNFYWENGIIEIPISYVPGPQGELEISSRIDESTWLSQTNSTFERFFENEPSTRVMTMLLHSFSFLEGNSTTNKHLNDLEKLESYRSFLHNLPDEYSIVSASMLQNYIDNEIIVGEFVIPLQSASNECQE